jgi:hypothetical protein
MSNFAEQFILNIIRPTLEYMNVWSQESELLLAGTAAKETGFSICSLNKDALNNTSLGIYGISSEKHRYIWDDYLAFQPDLASHIRGLASQHAFLNNPEFELITNLAYSTAIAWLIYIEAGLKAGTYNCLQQQAFAWRTYFHPSQSSEEYKYCNTFYKYINLKQTGKLNITAA